MRRETALRWLTARAGQASTLWIAAGCACLLGLPALSIGLIGDDEAHRGFVRALLRAEHLPALPWDLYDVVGRHGPDDIAARVSNGLLPWWSSRALSMAFFRPLSAASHLVDYTLWPQAVWWMHAQNLLWYGLLVVLLGIFYRGVLGAGPAALLALLLYTVDEAHFAGAAWIAGRNTLLTAVLVALVLVLHDRARRAGARRAARLLAPALLLALAASEGAIAAWAYLGAYALCLDRGPWRARLRPLLPSALVTLGFLALGRALGYGVKASGIYADPLSDPMFFLHALGERLPDVLREQFMLPQLVVYLLPAADALTLERVLTGLLALAAVIALPAVWHRPTARFFALGMLGSALPICAIGVTPRLLFLTGIGAHGLIAEVLLAAAGEARGFSRMRRGLLRGLAVLLLLIHLPLAAAVAPFEPGALLRYEQSLRRAATTLPPPGARESVLLLLNTTNFFEALRVALYRTSVTGAAPQYIHVLGASRTPVKLRRPTQNALLLEPEGGYLLERWSHVVRRPQERFRVGEVTLMYGVWVRVERVTADGRPARIRLNFRADDPRLKWVVWNAAAGRFERFVLPEVGGTRILPGADEGPALAGSIRYQGRGQR